MQNKSTISVTLAGNGGQSFFDMKPEDAKKLESLLKEGSGLKSFTFEDTKSSRRVIVAMDKLFVMEVEV